MDGARRQTKDHAAQAANSTALKVGARVGLLAFGLVHLLIAWIAIQVAWFGEGESASAGGALKTLASQPLGAVILWVTVAGLAALIVWQLTEAVWGHRGQEGAKLWWNRALSGGRAIVYAVLAYVAGKVAVGSGGSAGDGSSQESMTAQLMSVVLGRWLVAAIGVGIIVIAVLQARRGITTSFTDDLERGAIEGASGRTIKWLGQVGYVTKGFSLGLVGLLFAWAAVSHDSNKAGGLDDALKTLRNQPFGPYLLTLVGLGLAAFGVYCFAWARNLGQ